MYNIGIYIKHPMLIGFGLMKRLAPLFKNDEQYLKILFFLKMHKRLDLNAPKTFSEKQQWLKLYNRRPEYTTMVDKYAVKEYVANIIGEQYIIPTLGVWNKPEDIDFDSLPQQFVLKTTHGGGADGVVICKNKMQLDKKRTISKLQKCMKQNIYISLREWPYKDVPRRIIAEEYIENAPQRSDLPDYKFFCFNGEPKFCQVITGRGSKVRVDFFDEKWEHQPFHEPRKYPFAPSEPKRPAHFCEMWQSARLLAKDKPFVRIDFYDNGENFLFGEITFFPTSGMGGFAPSEYDEIFGSWIKLPEKAHS